MVKLLKAKGFVGEEEDRRAYSYFARISKEDYQEEVVDDVVKGDFDGSPLKLVNSLVKEQKLDATELKRLLKMIKGQK